MRNALIAFAVLAIAGCATSPGVGQRDAAGNPLLERLTPAEWAQIGPQAPVRLSVQTLIALSRQGVSPDEIIRRYYQTGTRLELTEAQLAALRKEGVDQRVLDYIASAEQDAARIDAITAQADQAAQARLAYDRALYAAWWGGYPYGGYWGPSVFPYAGYGWGRGGSGWYGGIGLDF
jgi:uncharacterized protein (DUF433 family)